MTDFVAVIRRAVDGLKDNTPEMRAKVYEKARSAVLKQLENMKPRPTDDVIARQMSKLDAAVVSVENEHADALPAHFDAEEAYDPPPPPPVVDEWEREPEPVAPPAPAIVPSAPVYNEAPLRQVVAAPYFEPPVRDEFVEPAPAAREWEAPASNVAAARQQPDLLWMPDDEEEVVAPPPPPRISSPLREVIKQDVAPPPMQQPVITPVTTPAMPEAGSDIPWDVSPFEEDQVARAPAQTRTPLRAVETARPVPAAPGADEWDALNDLSQFETPAPTSSRTAARPNKGKATDVEKIVSKLEGKSFRAQPKAPKINYAGIAAGIAGLIIVGVGGYGIWQYRDVLISYVNGAPATPAVQNASTKPAAPADANATKPAPAKEKPKQTQVATATPKDTAANGKFTQRLLPDGSETNESLNNAPKADGKEGKSVAEQTVKSKDVAATTPATPAIAATTAPATPDPAAGATTAPATPTTPADPAAAPADATAAPAATNTDPAAAPAPDANALPGGGEKMFLYEERLGEASPTAITGTVSWSIANDTTATAGKPQSEIQAKITVPDRGLSALISFKRNTDKSLPASHVVELVFSLPKDFDGGSIDSVQRIAMKQTEQDRGNALIAVPAKITDDFHMIALNDDPAAITSNTDLLKNRSWIDIPITYRNGRRALITIEKGPAGTEDFNKVMAEWAALSPA